MEVKIGVRDIARELVLESTQSPDAINQAVEAALTSGSVLRLEDERGRVVLVPANTIGYVELGAPESRKVGFGVI